MIKKCFFLLVLVGVFSMAHPPKGIDISVIQDRVTVEVTHPVGSSGGQHFIDLVELKVNKHKVVTQTYMKQLENKFKAIYIIPGLKKGDRLNAYARCNKFGDRSKSFIVEK